MGDDRRFEGRTVAVTGAGGFIGKAVSRHLASQGARVIGLDLDHASASRIEETGASFAQADVCDRSRLDAVLHRTDLVVHAAALVHEWGSMDDFVRVNVRGTANVLDAAASAGANRVIHISSVVVYGYDGAAEHDETAFHRVHGIPYIDTKSASDRLAARRGAIVIRPGDVYGPGSVPWTLRPARMARVGILGVPGRGEGLMLPLYVDDLTEAVALALKHGEPGEAYTVWDDEARVTFEEHFKRLARITGGREPRRLPRPVLELSGTLIERASRVLGKVPPFTARSATFLDRRGTVSTSKARERLGWRPRVPYEEGMRRTAEWLTRCGLAAGRPGRSNPA